MDEINKQLTIMLINTLTNDAILVEKMEKDYPQMTSKFKELCAEQYLTFLKKQDDYGPMNIAMNTNLKTDKDIKFAMTGLITRMNDKMSRLINLIINKSDKPTNEAVEDSFMDISVYAKIARVVLDGKWAK